MKEFITLVLFVSAVVMSNAKTVTELDRNQAQSLNVATNVLSKLTKEQRIKLFHAARYRRTGGDCIRPNSQQGEVFIINCQKMATAAQIEDVSTEFSRLLHFRITNVEGTFALPSPAIRGEASLFIVDDPTMPSLLSAPENRWALVNIAPLAAGRGKKKSFFNARVRKQLTRGIALLLGSQDSNYNRTLVGCVTNTEDLDQFPTNELPIDVIERMKKYARGYGITPEEKTIYKVAVAEGWAPAPTNDIQKAIWDKVHEIPKNPMKIEFDPKKGR